MSASFFFWILLALALAGFFKGRAWTFLLGCLFTLVFSWTTPMGIQSHHLSLFDLHLSPIRHLFIYLISGLGLIIGVYSHFYMRRKKSLDRFYGCLSLFHFACVLTVLSEHALGLVIAWELTSLMSFFLIGFISHQAAARRGARQALLLTSLGGLCLLGAVVMLAEARGTYSLDVLIHSSLSNYGESFLPAFIFLSLAVMTKSAQFPFHFWLPGAMKAPTPVSAYLHAATLVKLGLFLVALFWPLLSQSLVFHISLSTVGLITFAFGAVMAVFKRDLKEGLAYTTLSQLGFILALFAMSNEQAYFAAILALMAHGFYKSALFLSVGIIHRLSGTQDFRKISGLKSSHWLWVIVVTSAASMAGLLPTLGFLAKEKGLENLLVPIERMGVMVFSFSTVLIGTLFTVIFATLISLKPFLGKPREVIFKTGDKALFIVTSFLPFMGIYLGIQPRSLLKTVEEIFPTTHLEASLWPGWTLIFLISLLLITGGALTAFCLCRSPRFWALSTGTWFSMARFFQRVFFEQWPSSLRSLNIRLEKLYTQFGLAILLACFVALSFGVGIDNIDLSMGVTSSRHLLLSLSIFALSGLFLLLYRIDAIPIQVFFMGVIGYLIAFVFAIIGAPDLVLTQILIETATLVLLLLAWLGSKHKTPPPPRRRRQSVSAWSLSAIASLVAVSLFFNAFQSPFPKLSSLYFFENAVSAAHGTNIVNVILVDFRALDTLGEITVLAIAYIGALALTTRLQNLPKKISPLPERGLWVEKLAKWIALVLALIAIWFLWRGHDVPGGGFIGGVLLALSLFIRAMIYGKTGYPTLLVFGGLVIAYLSALLPWLGGTFFESFYLGIPTSVFFDLGVFFTVSGVIYGFFEIILRFKARSWILVRVQSGDDHA